MFEKGVAVIGSTTIDENITSAGRWRKAGGVTVYAGITYRWHGIATTVVSNIARKDKGVITALEKEEIIVCSGPTPQTTHFINEVTPKVRRQKMPLQSASIKADSLAGAIKRVSCIHLGPLHPGDMDPGVIDMVGHTKLPVVLDVQGYTRQIKGEIITTGVSQHLSGALKIAQIMKSNQLELEAILNFFNLDISALIKTYRLEECVVTCGNKGGFVQDKKGIKFSYTAPPVESIADPTGAGDVFLAAYLAGRFLNLRSIADACTYAAELSARQVSGRYIAQDAIGLPGIT
ncbi:MAG: hypothetical protein JRF72_02970 [Deltaproteobacteria bacterium]|nr:hypothetical protein [Deltaproteobacteria bacterium]